MRNAADPEWCTYVDRIGEDCNDESKIKLNHLGISIDVDKTFEWLYPLHILENPEACIKRSFLTVLNKDVDAVNEKILIKLNAKSGIDPSLYTLPKLILQRSLLFT